MRENRDEIIVHKEHIQHTHASPSLGIHQQNMDKDMEKLPTTWPLCIGQLIPTITTTNTILQRPPRQERTLWMPTTMPHRAWIRR